jgi:hypothetical protein
VKVISKNTIIFAKVLCQWCHSMLVWLQTCVCVCTHLLSISACRTALARCRSMHVRCIHTQGAGGSDPVLHALRPAFLQVSGVCVPAAAL